MKTNDFWVLIFNPFKRIAGWEAFGLGLIIMALTTFAGNIASVYYDGVIDVHTLYNVSAWKSWLMLAANIAILSTVMYLFGFTVGRGFRFIDILGTTTLAKAPFLLTSIFGLFVDLKNSANIVMKEPMAFFSSLPLIAFVLVTIPVVIWVIVLLYNAFKVSVGCKGIKLTVAFVSAIIVAEIIMKLFLYLILIH